MSFQVSMKTEGEKVTLALAGRFDLQAHREFKDAYEGALQMEGARTLELDFDRVDYMDSSALGMLLLLKEKAEALAMPVALTHCRETIRQILEVANFQKLFAIR